MKKDDVIVSSGNSELSSSEHELLKEVFDALHVSPDRIEKLIQKIKKRN